MPSGTGWKREGQAYGPADVEALVNRAVIRLQNAIDPANSPVRVKTRQDVADSEYLRCTYARRLYESGVDLMAIQQNLGYANTKTTLGYIGTLDADQRRPPAVYSFDLSLLRAGA